MKKIMMYGLFSLVFSGVAQAEVLSFDGARADAQCREKWTRRGVLDDGMYQYCLGLQREGYENAVDLYGRYSSTTPVEKIDEVVAFAIGKWAEGREYRMDMVAYEIEQQGEAYLNIEYEVNRGGVDAEALQLCVEKWIDANEPQWSMVEFCLKD